MSTSYYLLIEPFTCLRLNEGPVYDRLTVFEGGKNCGTLIMSNGVGRRLARCFREYDHDSICPLRTHWGGKDRGTVVTVNDASLPDDATVISEYGEVLTVKEVKARDGAKRTDGMPTELFGYDKETRR
jgi:hypothetical protein